MNRVIALLAASCALAVAACDEPDRDATPEPEVPAEFPVTPPTAEDAAQPAEAVAPVETPAPDATTLPADKRTSEESVRPESETLFY